jgi:hypothetical protein
MSTFRGRSRLGQIAAAHPLWCFYVLAYGLSWCFFLPMALTGSLSPSVIAAGHALISIPHTGQNPRFEITVDVR